MEPTQRQQLKEWIREQLEARIPIVHRRIQMETGLSASRQGIIGIAEAQMAQALTMIEFGFIRSSLDPSALSERVAIVAGVLDEMKTVPDA